MTIKSACNGFWPTPERRLIIIFATRNSQLATRNSQLATRNSQLATRNSQHTFFKGFPLYFIILSILDSRNEQKVMS